MIKSVSVLATQPSKRYEYGQKPTEFLGIQGHVTGDLKKSVDSRSNASINIINFANKTPLKLFLETSEETFEESLMAGGYGRYRTRDWGPQPQTMICGTTGAVLAPEKQPSPPATTPQPEPVISEKEAKKRKRLAAFRTEIAEDSDPLYPKLFTVQLVGRGRVLSDVPNPQLDTPANKKFNPSVTSPRKRKKEELPPTPPPTVLPDWPDSEFPWNLRSEERVKFMEREKAQKLEWIEKFLDRDSEEEEEEDEDEPEPQPIVDENEEQPPASSSLPADHTLLPQSQAPTEQIKEAESVTPVPPRIRSISFPSDPADARCVLIAQIDLRALRRKSHPKKSRRKHREHHTRESRRRPKGDKKRSRLCRCGGSEDGREILQCSSCQMRYHVECLGFRDKAEAETNTSPWCCPSCTPDSDAADDDVDKAEAPEPHQQPEQREEPPEHSGQPELPVAPAAPVNPAPFFPPRLRRVFDSMSKEPKTVDGSDVKAPDG